MESTFLTSDWSALSGTLLFFSKTVFIDIALMLGTVTIQMNKRMMPTATPFLGYGFFRMSFSPASSQRINPPYDEVSSNEGSTSICREGDLLAPLVMDVV